MSWMQATCIKIGKLAYLPILDSYLVLDVGMDIGECSSIHESKLPLSGICRIGYLPAFSLCRLARVAQELWSRRLHRAAQQADAWEAGIWMTAQSDPTWSRRRTPQPSVLGLLFLDGYDSSCKP